VNAAMRTQLVTISPYNAVEDAARLMLKHKIGGLPIVAEGKLIGIVTSSDMMKAFLNVVRAPTRSSSDESNRIDQPTFVANFARRQICSSESA
jgi:CBS domain-containing protein